MSLSNDQIERYRAQINLKKINIQGQIKIQNAKILVIGAGGIGAPVLQFITRAGVQNIGIVDHDTVSKSNLHRQILFGQKDLKSDKVKISKKKIHEIDKKIQVKTFKLKINKANIKSIIKNYDYIVDGTDNFKTKLLINDACYQQKKGLFIGAVGQLHAHVFFFNFGQKTPCLKCFMPRPPFETPRCQDEGILGTVTGLAGNIIANELIKEIAQLKSSITNRLLIIDLEKLTFRNVKIGISKKCKNHV